MISRNQGDCMPKRLLLDLHGGCNLKCRMCMVHGGEDRFPVKANKRTMPHEYIVKIADEVSPAKPLIFPTINGEPLLGQKFREKLALFKERGFNVICHTNGILLNEDYSKLLVNIGLDVLSCSIDAVKEETYRAIRGSNKFEQIKRAIMSLVDIRGDKTYPRIEVSFTRQEENWMEEKEFIDYWSRFVDVIRINSEFYPMKHISFADMPLPKKRVLCQSLYESMPIFYNGDVGLCCRDPFCEQKLGNVFQESVAAVWNGPALKNIRKLHERGEWDKIALCKDCDQWAAYKYEEEITDRFLIRKSYIFTYYNVLDRLSNWNNLIRGSHTPASLQIDSPENK